jgi:hypothetical protein
MRAAEAVTARVPAGLITEIFLRHVAGLVREMGVLARAEQDEPSRRGRRLGLGGGEPARGKGGGR